MLGTAIVIDKGVEFRSLREKLDFGWTAAAKVLRHAYNEMTHWQQLE